MDKAENLQFEREVRPVVWIRGATKSIFNKLQAFINRRFRYILGAFWPRKISNDDLWQGTKQDRVEITIRRRKWNWIGSATLSGNLPLTSQGSPLCGTLQERQTEKVMEKDHQARIRGYWNVLGASETDGTKSSPLEKDCGGPLLRSEWRGLD